VSTLAAACPHCGTPQPAGSPPVKESSSTGNWAVGIGVVTLLMLGICSQGDRISHASSDVAAVRTPSIGEWAHPKGRALACPTKEAMQRLASIAQSHDEMAFALAVLRQGCTYPDSTVRLYIEDSDGQYRRVRPAGDPTPVWMVSGQIEY
jgi:hypothetical protein